MPILNQDTFEFVSRNVDQTRRLGARLGVLLEGGDIIALEGNLGAGKTVLAQGIGRGWGAQDPLISPTFVLMRRHTRLHDQQKLYHIDFYRLQPTEIAHLGLEEILGMPGNIAVIEWADRAPEIISGDYLRITLNCLDEYRRTLTFHAAGDRHNALLENFRKEIIGR